MLVFLIPLALGDITLAQNKHWVDSTFSTMSVEEKVGQLFIADVAAVYAHQESAIRKYASRMIRERHVGGFVLAGGTVSDIALMTNSLQEESTIPLLINADLEAGLGFGSSWQHVRGRAPELPHFLSGGGTIFTSMMAVGGTQKPEYAYQIGRITAREGRAIGIHWTNAPVADVNVNPLNPIINTRSFGEDPQKVAEFVSAFVRGLQEGGVIATLKHFPGHGDTEEDSHMQLPVLPFDERRLSTTELVPFRAGIESGAKAVMTAHIALPKIDPSSSPSTLSHRVVTGILRERLGFNGIVITDGMTMEGVTKRFEANEAAVLAILAGADCILVPDDFEKAFNGVLDAVKSGRITLARLDASVRRILELKSWAGIDKNRFVDVENIANVVGSPAADSIAEAICADAVTLLKNEGNLVPLKKQMKVSIVACANEYNYQGGQELRRALQARQNAISLDHVFEGSRDEEIERIVTLMKRADVVVLAVYLSIGSWKGRLELAPRISNFLRKASQSGKPVVTIAFGDPYVIARLPETEVVMTPFAGGRRAERSVALALMGEIDIKGKLPVTIPGKYKIGEGIEVRQRRSNRDR